MNFLTKYKYIIIELSLLFILSLSPFLWFKSGYVVLGMDSGYPVNYEKYLDQRVFAWMASHNFGVDFSAEVGVLPYSSLPAILSHLGVPYFSIQKVFFSAWIFVMLVSAYALFRYLYADRKYWLIRLAGTIIYIFNLHLYSFMIQGEQPILASYALLPLFTLILLKFIRKEYSILKTAILLNCAYLFFGAGGIRGVPLVGPTILVSITISIYYLLFNWRTEGFNYVKRFVALAVIFILLFLGFNAYYILPFIGSFSHEFNNQVTIAGGKEGAISWAKFISTHASFTNLFRLQGDNNWYANSYLFSNTYLVNPILILMSFIFSVLAWCAPILVKVQKEKKLVIYFAVFALVSMFLASGTHSPFGNIYIFLMDRVPGFATFRSAWYKFMPGVFFAYAFLVSVAGYYLIQKIKTIFLRKYVAIAFLLFFIGYNYPYFQNSNFVHNKPFSLMVKVPDYIKDFAEFRNSEKDDYRTLVLPRPNLAYTIKTYKWGYWSSYPIFPLISDKSFVQYDTYLFNEDESAFIKYLYQKLRVRDYENFKKAARLANIHYILLTRDMAHDYFLAPAELPTFYEKILSDKSQFTSVWKKGEWELFDINNIGQLQKIKTLPTMSMSLTSTQNIAGLLDHTDQDFIMQNQIPKEIVQKLPISAFYRSYECLSCKILDNTTPIAMPLLRVNPGGIFYGLKVKYELSNQRESLANSQEAYAEVGLSLKRLGEIDGVKTRLSVSKVRNDVAITFKSFLGNLRNINNYLTKNHDALKNYDLLKVINSHIVFEEKSFRAINTGHIPAEDTELVSLAKEIIELLQKTKSTTQDALYKYPWENTFVYDLRQDREKLYAININKSSIPTDKNIQIKPYAYGIDDNIASISAENLGEELDVKNVPGNSSYLTLFYPISPNLADNLVASEETFLNAHYACLGTKIRNYSWENKYSISVTSADSDAPKTIFIRKYKSMMDTQDYTPAMKKHYSPDMIIAPSNSIGETTLYPFSGEPNDRSVSVYFCTDPGFDPASSYSNMSIRQNYIPEIFTLENKKITDKHRQPTTSFTRLDPTHYRVVVKNATDPYVLSFLEGYSPNWQLSRNSKIIQNHFRVNGFANAWYIDMSGSYTLDITFYTQTNFYKGLIVTMISVILGVLYLILYRRKRITK